MQEFTLLSNGDVLYLVTDDVIVEFECPMLTSYTMNIDRGRPMYSGLEFVGHKGREEITADFSLIARDVTRIEGGIDPDMLFKDDVLDNMSVNELLDNISKKVDRREH